MDYIDHILEAGGAARMMAGLKFRVPIPRLFILTDSKDVWEAVKIYRNVLLSQLNAKEVILKKKDELTEFMEKYAQPDLSKLGPVFKGDTPKVTEYIKSMEKHLTKELMEKGSVDIEVDGRKYVLNKDMVVIKERPLEDYVVKEFEYGYVVLYIKISDKEIAEGLARDVVRRIQFMRKEMDLAIDAYIETYVKVPDESSLNLLKSMENYIANETRSKVIKLDVKDISMKDLYVKEWDISGDKYIIGIREYTKD